MLLKSMALCSKLAANRDRMLTSAEHANLYAMAASAKSNRFLFPLAAPANPATFQKSQWNPGWIGIDGLARVPSARTTRYSAHAAFTITSPTGAYTVSSPVVV